VFTNDFKVKIKKVIFTQKGKSLSHKKYIIDILIYCHGTSDKFITESNKMLLRNYVLELSVSVGRKSEVLESIENNEGDLIILKNLFIDLLFFKECHQIESKMQQKLHFLNILFFDYLILETVFTKFFELDNDFNIKNIEEIIIKKKVFVFNSFIIIKNATNLFRLNLLQAFNLNYN
jgi:hypothetical protein